VFSPAPPSATTASQEYFYFSFAQPGRQPGAQLLSKLLHIPRASGTLTSRVYPAFAAPWRRIAADAPLGLRTFTATDHIGIYDHSHIEYDIHIVRDVIL